MNEPSPPPPKKKGEKYDDCINNNEMIVLITIDFRYNVKFIGYNVKFKLSVTLVKTKHLKIQTNLYGNPN